MDQKEERLSRALSAQPRREIIRILSKNESTVKDIAKKSNISVSLASRHLKFLYDLGFLSIRKKYPFKYYSLRIKELKNLLELYDKVSTKL